MFTRVSRPSEVAYAGVRVLTLVDGLRVVEVLHLGHDSLGSQGIILQRLHSATTHTHTQLNKVAFSPSRHLMRNAYVTYRSTQ